MLENAEITTKMIRGYPKFENDRWMEYWQFDIVVTSKENKLCAFSSLELGSDGNWLGFGTKQQATKAGKVKLDAMRNSSHDTYIESMITNEVNGYQLGTHHAS